MVQSETVNGSATRHEPLDIQEEVTMLQKPVEAEGGDTSTPKEWKRRVFWPNAIGYFVVHMITLYGFYVGLTQAKVLTCVWTVLVAQAGGLSITMGAHRLYSHRAYKAKPMFRLAMNVLQTLTGQHCMWVWIRDHRQHHKYSDTDADPHNAKAGFFFSHMGWLMCYKHPDVIRVGKQVDMSDIDADPYVMFQKKYYYWVFFVVSFLIPVVIPVWVWGEDPYKSVLVAFLVRSVGAIHFTWLVNSYAHMFGNRPYTSDILPTETSLIAFLSMGEGWHNYHHTFPWDYRASELGRLNVTTYLLDQFAKWGWIYDLRYPSPQMIKEHILKRGDGTHPLAKYD